MMASIATTDAPSRAPWRLQTPWRAWLRRGRGAIEDWLEAEREQLPLWIPVAIGAGVAAWFVLPMRWQWEATALAAVAVAVLALALGRGGRAGVSVAVAGALVAAGVGLAWWRAERVAQPVLSRPAVVRLRIRVERVEPLPARELVRLRAVPLAVLPVSGPRLASAPPLRPVPNLPPRVRINLADADVPAGLARGSVLELGARLMPPQVAGVPGAYDYARLAWFDGIGASGRGYGPVRTLVAAPAAGDSARTRLTRHIEGKLAGSVGGVAAAFVTGDVGAIGLKESDDMRRAGLAHLLSISGLHITAAVGFTMVLMLRLLALFPWLALRFRLPMIAAGAGAAAAIGYTLLSGAEVPTIRSCVAALLVLGALALGREAVTLRLVAAGAFAVLILWPESLAGPSFQLSFAAVTAIVALHEHPWVRQALMKRDEPRWRSLVRELASLLATGILVELALMPIAVYHFHKAGLYGAFANIVAIPLSTFVVMPAEALALLLDPLGLSGPLWWATGKSIALLLWIAKITAAQPGAVTVLPSMPDAAFALMVAGGLWLALWRTRWRRLGLVPLAIGAGWALVTPPPDLLVTGDGRHVAVRTPAGRMALLRDRSSDYTQDMLTVNGGVDGAAELLGDQPTARCSQDLCLATRTVGARQWRILATRSGYNLPIDQFVALCGSVDIVVSDRRLPRRCRPRWLLLTPATLRRTGGLAITLSSGRIATVLTSDDEHPWALAAHQVISRSISRSGAGYRRACPECAPVPGHNAADHRSGWRDRAAPSRLRDGRT
jgi:competence protein ComEC